MARIRAGNTLANQYAPPFSISDGVASGWQLRWNERLKAFEAYDPDPFNKEEAGFESIVSYEIYASQNQVEFIIPFRVPSKEALLVTINGVKQHQDSYVLDIISYGETSTGVIFQLDLQDEPIAAGDRVEFLGLIARTPTNIRLQTFDAVDYDFLNPPTYFDLNWIAQSKESLIVTVYGVKQQVSSYNINIVGNKTRLFFEEQVAPVDNTPGIWLEIVGILDSPNMPGTAVDVQNTGAGGTPFGLFKEQINVGLLQVLQFRSLRQGNNIYIEPLVDDTYRISGRGIVNVGTGSNLFQGTGPAPNDPFELRTLAGKEGQIDVVGMGSTIQLQQHLGYRPVTTISVAVTYTDRLIAVRNTANGDVDVILPTPPGPGDALPPGTRITVKDESGTAGSPHTIRVYGASGRTIDGGPIFVISNAYGSVTVYTDGNDWFTV